MDLADPSNERWLVCWNYKVKIYWMAIKWIRRNPNTSIKKLQKNQKLTGYGSVVCKKVRWINIEKIKKRQKLMINAKIFSIFIIEMVQCQGRNRIRSKYALNICVTFERRQKYNSVTVWVVICSSHNTSFVFVEEELKNSRSIVL